MCCLSRSSPAWPGYVPSLSSLGSKRLRTLFVFLAILARARANLSGVIIMVSVISMGVIIIMGGVWAAHRRSGYRTAY